MNFGNADSLKLPALGFLKKPIVQFCALFIVLEFLTGIWIEAGNYPSQDVAVHLDTAFRILRGQKLYQDILTIQLPAIFYLRMPGAILAEKTGWDPFIIAQTFDNVAAIATFFLSQFIYRRIFFSSWSTGAFCIFNAALGLALFILPSFGHTPGEKEFFYLVFTLPYFLLAAATVMGVNFSNAFRVSIGILGGLGFFYKPCSILPLLFVESYLCWETRSLRTLWRGDFLACVTTGVIYLLWILVCFPGYTHTILPLMHFYLLGSSSSSYLPWFAMYHIFPFLIPCLMLWFCLLCRGMHFIKFYNVIFLTYLGYLLNGLVQMKPYHHHYYPMYALSVLVFASVCATILKPIRSKSAAPLKNYFFQDNLPVTLMVLLILGFTVMLDVLDQSPGYYKDVIDRVTELSKPLSRPPVVYQLSYSLSPFFPYGTTAGLEWDFHFNELWLLNGIRQFKKQHVDQGKEWNNRQTGRAEQFLLTTVNGDIDRLKPDFLIFDQHSDIILSQYFETNLPFRRVFDKNYRYLEDRDGMEIYARILFRKQILKMHPELKGLSRPTYDSIEGVP